MRFKANYKPTNPYREASITMKPYWRTIDADSVNEATDLAKRMTRKGYMLGAVIQDLGKE